MQEKHLFEYAVIRVVPKVDREEFVNTGIILYCKKLKYLQCKYYLDVNKLRVLSPDLDFENVEANLISFKKICDGSKDGGPIAALDVPSRFRWLTATRSTVVQTSKTHPGFCKDMEGTLQKLFEQYVL